MNDVSSGDLASAIKASDRPPLGLRATSVHNLNQAFVASLKTLEREQLSTIVDSLKMNLRCSENFAQVMRQEFLRFFGLMQIASAPLSPNALADTFWHAFLMHTKDYRDFCERNFGRFIDHHPSFSRKHDVRPDVGRALYESCFGRSPFCSVDDRGNLIVPSTIDERSKWIGAQLSLMDEGRLCWGPDPNPPFKNFDDWDRCSD